MMQMHQVALGPGVPPLSCAEQRQLQLLQIEMEQRREEQEALGITEEQCQILLHTFKSVKIEFSNLDGLKSKPHPLPLHLSHHHNIAVSMQSKLSSGKKRRTAHSGFVGLLRTGTGTGMVLVMMHVQVSVYESLLDTPMPLLRASPAPLSSPLPLPILTPTIMPTRGSHLKETW
ncbi:hypothetical protein BDQ17DRAFT_1379883 [Cyathus striatus]|nr:hypothetical protein BDQ17DRAFT_1379883 [Cyathus striatus]